MVASGVSLRVSVHRVLAALASSALALANWFRARRVRVREVTGSSWGWRAHRGRGRGEEALQARLIPNNGTGRGGKKEKRRFNDKPLILTSLIFIYVIICD